MKCDEQDLLSLSVAVGLAVRSNMLLVSLGGLVGGSGSNQLVRELSLVPRVGDLHALLAHRSRYEAKGHTVS